MSFFGAIGSFIMTPLYYVISVVMIGFHNVISKLLEPAGGASWVLSIVGLTVVIRAALIPLFVKQIKSSRNMQMLQPKVKELQKKYGHDRERLAQETMALYRDAGTNPFASCLPILLQMPIFFALFRLLDAASDGDPRGVLSKSQAEQFGNAELFGVPISKTFITADGDIGVQIMALFFVLAMLVTTFLTQRQLMTKNMPESAMTGPYAQQQKMLLYVLPVVFAVGGVAFPIGVLVYWTVSNLWTMSQQFYVIRRNPAPGTPAAQAKAERDAHKAARKGHPVVEEPGSTMIEPAPEPPRPAKRQQPQRKPRSQRKQPPKKRS
ncbi:membrane protein insertase YidC [Nocardioides donggukensis]|uniref:Membrane protein insertase YidC n=1 Tax=Nocardioides donggukensis TaxID=2774019 RepID=A0A927KB72_9ACTN|nr:membrane protein insertase YidC [Nocardioides donggukensis]MBD8870985.1 membrane protein insertase YidC [Nocardioides donggukensis]